jgi:hypothetical protein
VLGFNRWHLLKGLAAILCIVGIVSLALIYFFPAPPSTITIAAGIKGGAFEHIAESYRERLARAHVTLDVRLTDGALDSLRLVEDRSSGVDVAFLFGGISNSKQSPGLMSLKLRASLVFLPWTGDVRPSDTTKGQTHRSGTGTRLPRDPRRTRRQS